MAEPLSLTSLDELLVVAVISDTQFGRVKRLISSSSIIVIEKNSTSFHFYRFSLANNPPLLKPLGNRIRQPSAMDQTFLVASRDAPANHLTSQDSPILHERLEFQFELQLRRS
jgi:hypothetical protein